MLYSDLTEAIGHTPMIELRRLNPNPAVKIFAKLEGFNPTGSLKDRIVKYMIERAEASGELTPDKILLEPTSGNTGIAYAMIAAAKGYKTLLAVPENVSTGKKKLLTSYGAELLLTDPLEGSDGSSLVIQELYDKSPEQYFYPSRVVPLPGKSRRPDPCHYHNPINRHQNPWSLYSIFHLIHHGHG